ncbi:porin [Chitinophaga agrisoli]|nr:porin [Chitinophaga agrisoli]
MRTFKCLLVLLPLLLLSVISRAQFLMDMIDTTTELGKGMFSMYKKYDALRFSGYIQPQFQYISSKGAKSFSGGDFPAAVNNRFTLRRGRLRVDYERHNDDGTPSVLFAFQFDGTERGVFIRDFYGRFFEHKWDVLSISGGMFARPFGYEVNLASADRESPERGRMSQLLMRTERDLGAMISFEPRRKDHPLRFLKIDAGLFNGQGLSGPSDFDSHKDLIARIALKPVALNASGWKLSGGISTLYGGMQQFTKYIYRSGNGPNGHEGFMVDSAVTNEGKIAPRHYYGADVQLRIPNKKGFTELRAEYLRGTQTATAASSETPGTIPVDAIGNHAPLYIRKFDGAYIYFLQHLGSPEHQIALKYDWYDPNLALSGHQIGQANTNTTEADIRFDTFGAGYLYYVNEHLKITLWYDLVRNESTDLQGYTTDVKDNVFTCRLQYRF